VVVSRNEKRLDTESLLIVKIKGQLRRKYQKGISSYVVFTTKSVCANFRYYSCQNILYLNTVECDTRSSSVNNEIMCLRLVKQNNNVKILLPPHIYKRLFIINEISMSMYQLWVKTVGM
jgi:hypothetical protein